MSNLLQVPTTTPPLVAYPEADAEQVQSTLAALHRELGLASALHALYQWCLASGYLPAGIFEADELRRINTSDYPDLTGQPLQLLLQINRSREQYQQAPLSAEAQRQRNSCALCRIRPDDPTQAKLRRYQFDLNNRPVLIQHTPFPFHRGHYVLMDLDHTPMRMDRTNLEDLTAFLLEAPTYTACSNSDVAWAGASILGHHHYQLFAHFDLPVMHARPGAGLHGAIGQTRFALLNYPAAILRIEGDRAALIELGSRVLRGWKATDPGRATANLILHRREPDWVLHLIFRHSDFRTAPPWRELKEEGVGVLEIGGMVIVPKPRGPGAAERMARIDHCQLELVTGIMSSNSPRRGPREFADLFDQIIHWLNQA